MRILFFNSGILCSGYYWKSVFLCIRQIISAAIISAHIDIQRQLRAGLDLTRFALFWIIFLHEMQFVITCRYQENKMRKFWKHFSTYTITLLTCSNNNWSNFQLWNPRYFCSLTGENSNLQWYEPSWHC